MHQNAKFKVLSKIFYQFRQKLNTRLVKNCEKVSPKTFEYRNCIIESTSPGGEFGDFRGSIMMSPKFQVKNELDFFCDDSGQHKHDKEKRTLHNELCKGKSAWAVIRESEDYKASGRPSSKINAPPTDFTVVQPREDGNSQRIVFVLDVSGSMEGFSIEQLKSQCNDFIKSSDAREWGFNLGIVQFRYVYICI